MMNHNAPIEIRDDYVNFLVVNGMKGRFIKLPANYKTKKQIVVFGGFLSSAEKHFGLLEYLREFGNVNYIDLPGYGGMDSLYKINEYPLRDNYGDYIFSVLKTLKFNSRQNRPIIVCLGSSISFVANLLSRHKGSSKWFKRVIHIDGIDTGISTANYGNYDSAKSMLLKLASNKKSINRLLYIRMIGNTKEDKLESDERALLEHLLSVNDLRTHLTVMDEDYNPVNDPSKLNMDVRRSVFLVRLDSVYKNFKLYDSESISKLLPKQIEDLLVA